jgi:diketogulonate reductase-like aldo/keto reductase
MYSQALSIQRVQGKICTLSGWRTKMSTKNQSLLTRRQFGARAAALGLSLPMLGAFLRESASAQSSAAGAAAKWAAPLVKFPDGTTVPPIGLGCWHLGQDRHPVAVEEDALRTGLSMGVTLLDTSGNYGAGRSEQFLSHVIADRREKIFLVSKVEPSEVADDGILRACAASLARLGTPYLDLYLMHQPLPSAQLPVVVAAFEQLRSAGKIRAWGVSNFKVELMEDLFKVPMGDRCATNQVPYSLNHRNIERDVLPWCKQHNLPIMAYSPLGGDHNLIVADRTLGQIGAAHGCSASAVALAWAIRSGNVIAIPESGAPEHVKDDLAALSLSLTPEDLKTIDSAFPGPTAAS